MNVQLNAFKKRKRYLQERIKEKAVFFNKAVNKGGDKMLWCLDLKLILLNSTDLAKVTELIGEIIKKKSNSQDNSLCLGCITLSADPLLGSLTYYLGKKGFEVNSFIVRKEKKKHGFTKLIEGNIQKRKDIILLDDVINSGESLIKAIIEIEKSGGKVKDVIVIVDFNRKNKREFFKRRKINIISLFKPKDINLEYSAPQDVYIWKIKKFNVSNYRASKSSPIIYKDNIFIGTDTGNFSCLDHSSGYLRWRLKVKPIAVNGIHSTACAYKDKVFFGSYNGILYSFSTESGKLIWKKKICGSIGSSVQISFKTDRVFVGTEYAGRKEGKGGIACLDVKTGMVFWEKVLDKEYIHCTPSIDDLKSNVLIGSNSGHVFNLNLIDGNINWQIKCPNGPDGRSDIKTKIVLDSDFHRSFVGSFNRNFYCLKPSNGRPMWFFRADSRINFTPFLIDEYVIFGSVDGYLYCLNKENGKKIWTTKTRGGLQGGAINYGEYLIAADLKGFIYFIEIETGKIIRELKTDDWYNAIPAVYEDKLILGNKSLWCWNLRNFFG